MERFTSYINLNDKVEIIIKDGNDIAKYVAYYKKTRDENIIISPPQNPQRRFNYKSGQDLIIYLYTKGGIFKLNSVYLYSDNENCFVSLPNSSERIQRREYIRVDMPVKFAISVSNKDNLQKFEGVTRNISAKGLNANLKIDISFYSKIEVTLQFPDKTIRTLARTVKVRNIEVKKTTLYNTSLEFMSISEKEMNYIVKKCFEYETLERRKMLES